MGESRAEVLSAVETYAPQLTRMLIGLTDPQYAGEDLPINLVSELGVLNANTIADILKERYHAALRLRTQDAALDDIFNRAHETFARQKAQQFVEEVLYASFENTLSETDLRRIELQFQGFQSVLRVPGDFYTDALYHMIQYNDTVMIASAITIAQHGTLLQTILRDRQHDWEEKQLPEQGITESLERLIELLHALIELDVTQPLPSLPLSAKLKMVRTWP